MHNWNVRDGSDGLLVCAAVLTGDVPADAKFGVGDHRMCHRLMHEAVRPMEEALRYAR